MDANPYLTEFDRDMRAWSFYSQVFLLSQRLRRHCELMQHAGTVIQDRTVYEDAEEFAATSTSRGCLASATIACTANSTRCWAISRPRRRWWCTCASVETLRRRIALRGHTYEHEISAAYPERLNALYDQWVARLTLRPVLEIEIDDIDLAHRDDGMHAVARRVLACVAAIEAPGRTASSGGRDVTQHSAAKPICVGVIGVGRGRGRSCAGSYDLLGHTYSWRANV